MTTVHRTTATALLIAALAAADAPTASAHPGGTAHHPPLVYSRQDKSLLPANDPPPAVVQISSPDGGFAWGDAGIGAAGGFALSMIAIGGALVIAPRRTRRRHTIPTR
jgi:hypothetical protein